MKTFFRRIARKLFNSNADLLRELSAEDQKLVEKIRKSNLTYLSGNKLASIIETVRRIENEKLPGLFIEAGCALGGSTILISSIKKQNRPLFVYDVFSTIPPPSVQDGEDVQKRFEDINQGKAKGLGGDGYYGYEEDLYNKVLSNLLAFGISERQDNVCLIKGLLEDTLKVENIVAFAHIDVDWYEPVKICLERTIPNLCIGGTVILDDYYAWSGCRKATDEYLSRASGKFDLDDSAGSMKITRIKD